MTKASVIIPVYNAEKLLPRCFDSILNQSYRDFEIIVINVGRLYPEFLHNKNVSLTLPKGETFFNRFSVWFFILLHRIHAVRLFLSVYCKGRKE